MEKFSIDQVKEKRFKFDSFKWLKDEDIEDLDELPEPEELITDALSELKEAIDNLNKIYAELTNGH